MKEAQINYARELIEARHQLRETPLAVALPYLKQISCCCLRKQKRSFKNGLKRALRHRMDMKVSKSEILIEENPYLLLGYGMNSYFEVVAQLIKMMLFFSVFAIPLMLFFSTFSALDGQSHYMFNQFAMGNMGGSTAFCAQTPFNHAGSGSGSMVLRCRAGQMSLKATAQNTGKALF